MESCLRLRLAFKNGGDILSETQQSQGLKKSWILLQQPQQLQTIADLSAHIIQTFHLHQSCPNGLLLKLDGFVLPPFESTSILKDRDIVSVKKKGGVLPIEGNDAADNVEEMQIVEKQPANCGALLLANEEFEKESGGYQSNESDDESEEEDEGNDSDNTEHLEGGNAVSKKRKAPEKLQGLKKKKQRTEPPTNVENEDHCERIESSHQGVPAKKKSVAEKEKLSKHENATTIKANAKSAKKSDGNVESTPSPTRNEQLQNDGKDIGNATHVSESTRKVPSRSARRKYAKRRWLREMAKIQKKSLDSSSKEVQNWKQAHAKAGKKEEVGQPKGLLHWKQFGRKDMSKTSGKNEEDNRKGIFFRKPIQNGMKDEVVPVVKRPGHIRFEHLEEDQAAQQSQLSAETFQWNGITSKKKGQKWGTNSSSFSQRNDCRELKQYSLNIEKDTHPRGQNLGTNRSSVSRRNDCREVKESMNIEKDTHPREPMDFDKLPPLPSVPKEGDVIAYRLLELSSSWTPEISSFRVGKVSWYNSKFCKIMLMPVQQFPIDSGKSNEDESAGQPDNSLYNEDGSLEIDFRSLVDVRVINDGNLATAKAVPDGASGGVVNNENAVASAWPSSNNKQTNALIPETGGDNHDKSAHAPRTESGVNLWEQFSEAQNSKKEELSKENGWGKATSGRSSMSSRPWWECSRPDNGHFKFRKRR